MNGKYKKKKEKLKDSFGRSNYKSAMTQNKSTHQWRGDTLKYQECKIGTHHRPTPQTHVQVHLNNVNVVKKFIFSCNLFQKVKLSYILDSLHVK